MTEQHEWRDDVGAYLLGALSPEEEAAFEAQLEVSEELRAKVEHLRVAADALPSAVIQLAPPPALKNRVMAVVNAEAELLRAAGPSADRPEPAPRPRRTLAGLSPGWWSGRRGLALAATLLVLVLGGAAGIAGQSLLGGGDSVQVAKIGSAKLIQKDGGHSTLVATDLPSPGRGRVYQVWLQRPGRGPEPTNALFGTRRDGTASVDVPGSLEDVDAVLVTSEPEGGSSKPTTKPVIVANPA